MKKAKNFRALAWLGAALPLLGVSVALAQETTAPVQAPIDGNAPAAPATPATPDAPANTQTPIQNAPARLAAQYSDAEVRALGQGPAFPYSLLESALSRAVDERNAVNYNKLQLDEDLKLFVRAVSLADMNQFPVFKIRNEDGQTRDDRNSELTFWINAYNGLFLDALAKGYPVKAVSQVKDLQTAKRNVGGKTYTFPEMRTKIAQLDARALFALTDGTIYGPRVGKNVFRYFGLGAQLNAAVRNFVVDPIRVPVPDRLGKVVNVSPFLQGVDEHFKKGATRRKWSGVQNVLSAYAPNSALRNYYGAGDFEIRFFPPNDAINDPVNML